MTETQISIAGQQYRLRRYDKLNIVLERWNIPTRQGPPGSKPAQPCWLIEAYCGNSQRAIVRAVSEAITAQHTPVDDQLTDQIEALRWAVEEGTAAITAALASAPQCNENARFQGDILEAIR